MSDTEQTATTEVEETPSEVTQAAAPESEQTVAVDTTDWKAMARKHEKEAKQNREAARKLAAIEAESQTEAERLAAERDAANEKVKAAVRRAVTAEVKAVATALKFQDSSDAIRMLDMDEFTGDDGEVNEGAVKAALEAIAEKKPYLLAPSTAPAPARSGGPVGGGAPVAGQVTDAELATMTPAQIEQAQKDGRLAAILGRRPED